MDLNNPVNFVALFILFVPFLFALAIGLVINIWERYFPKDDEEIFDDKDYPYERVNEDDL